jgi:hypothetical protein
LVNPQKITLTCLITKIALLACDVAIPFAVDRHSAQRHAGPHASHEVSSWLTL